MAAPGRGETVQKQIQQDWVNREYVEIITISIKKITDFLNSFGDQGRDAHMRPVLGPAPPRRSLFRWINLQFNAVDRDRIRTVGPDRVCAEWILRNGGRIRWTDSPIVLSDYNDLPSESLRLHLKEVDATDSSVMHNGFEHFKGCRYVSDVVLHRCYYLEDEGMGELRYLKGSLTSLQVSSCPNLTDGGLMHLGALHGLRRLVLADLASVKDLGRVAQALKGDLPNCNVQTKL